MNRVVRKLCKAASCGVLGLALLAQLGVGSPAGLGQPHEARPEPAHRGFVAGDIMRNRHLKGVDDSASPGDKTAIKADEKRDVKRDDKEHAVGVHHPWHARWDYHHWMSVHRTTGVIRGYVHTSSGSPMASVRVALRRANGRIFSDVFRKHVTYTDDDGNFSMTSVRTGAYRVVIGQGKRPHFAHTSVAPGSVTLVSVKG